MNKELLYQQIAGLLKTLDNIQEEQSAMKRKLSILLDKSLLNNYIEWAEEIHQQILNRETAIQLLRKDMSSLKKAITLKKSIIIFADTPYHKSLEKFKEQVSYLENEFNHWAQFTNEKFQTISA
jgi:hypothetical protein